MCTWSLNSSTEASSGSSHRGPAGWVSLLVHTLWYLLGVGLNGKVAFVKVSRSGPRTVMFVAMEMNTKFLVHHCHLSRTRERNGQVAGLTGLLTEAFVD